MAAPDKLGMRISGRPTIRPVPPLNEQTDHALKLGSAVDAWWSDGWWEGVITGIDSSGNDMLQVYFPGKHILGKLYDVLILFLLSTFFYLLLLSPYLGDKLLCIRRKLLLERAQKGCESFQRLDG